MRYGITGLKFSEETFVRITKAKFERLLSAKADALLVLSIEERLELLVVAYLDYERQLHAIAQERAISSGVGYAALQSDRLMLTSRLVGVLATATLYIDHVKHDVSTLFGAGGTAAVQKVSAACSREYDRLLGYRVMQTLRNVLQHRAIHFFNLTYSGKLIEGSQGRHWQDRVDPVLHLEYLRKEEKFKRTVLAELEARGGVVTITPLLREYIEGIGAVHDTVRELVGRKRDQAQVLLRGAQTQLAERYGGGPNRTVELVELDRKGEVHRRTHVFSALLDYAKQLQTERNLRGLSRRFVSGAPLDVL